jgi:2-polyprenyl-3-methyl-5-hydroxy-6-metoxy-1,4-benzoquinol methylase
LHIPRSLGWLLSPLKARLVEPFEIAEVVALPKGKLMDVGCGNGRMLSLGRKLGWQAMGLEVDPSAARTARAQGLDVLEGSYTRLAEFRQQFDCIICSHVLEHVHDPQDMLIKLAEALKPGGTLLLSLPNATSLLRRHFGDDWRGLEAPRHLSIPSMSQLEANLREMGFSVRQRQLTRLWTAAESSRIQRRGTRLNTHDKAVAKRLTADTVVSSDQEHDFVQFVCVRDTRRVL